MLGWVDDARFIFSVHNVKGYIARLKSGSQQWLVATIAVSKGVRYNLCTAYCELLNFNLSLLNLTFHQLIGSSAAVICVKSFRQRL